MIIFIYVKKQLSLSQIILKEIDINKALLNIEQSRLIMILKKKLKQHILRNVIQ